MEYIKANQLWREAISDILDTTLDDNIIHVLSMQMIDSIRRISIYRAYYNQADKAESSELPYHHTSNPFKLCQRESLTLDSKIWYIYIATYFGKSNKSGWNLFKKASFYEDGNLIDLDSIINNREEYFDYLRSLDFFEKSNYSNHRKFTKKALDGDKGFLNSANYFLDNLSEFSSEEVIEFDTVYKKALLIPNFGRMAAFDFTSSLCKCNLNVAPPISMYHKASTGPLKALKELLIQSGTDNPTKKAQIRFGDNLLDWFVDNSDIEIVAQVLEDTICNWQKSPHIYRRYFG